jgi:hypothetical protein
MFEVVTNCEYGIGGGIMGGGLRETKITLICRLWKMR